MFSVKKVEIGRNRSYIIKVVFKNKNSVSWRTIGEIKFVKLRSYEVTVHVGDIIENDRNVASLRTIMNR